MRDQKMFWIQKKKKFWMQKESSELHKNQNDHLNKICWVRTLHWLLWLNHVFVNQKQSSAHQKIRLVKASFKIAVSCFYIFFANAQSYLKYTHVHLYLNHANSLTNNAIIHFIGHQVVLSIQTIEQ